MINHHDKESKQFIRFLQSINSFANAAKKEVYIVGGYVRDSLCQSATQITDLDLVINCDAINFIKKYQEHLKTNDDAKLIGKVEIVEAFDKFKTVKISVESLNNKKQNYDIELASARTETYPHPAAFPLVCLTDDIKPDLSRRDFTINALLLPLDFNPEEDLEKQVLDYVGGINDFKNKLIRVFHDRSFIDDPTRIYRALRFKFKLDFEIEQHTWNLLREACLHKDFSKWLKKRKGRFDIEMNHIRKLGAEKHQEVLAILRQVVGHAEAGNVINQPEDNENHRQFFM